MAPVLGGRPIGGPAPISSKAACVAERAEFTPFVDAQPDARGRHGTGPYLTHTIAAMYASLSVAGWSLSSAARSRHARAAVFAKTFTRRH